MPTKPVFQLQLEAHNILVDGKKTPSYQLKRARFATQQDHNDRLWNLMNMWMIRGTPKFVVFGDYKNGAPVFEGPKEVSSICELEGYPSNIKFLGFLKSGPGRFYLDRWHVTEKTCDSEIEASELVRQITHLVPPEKIMLRTRFHMTEGIRVYVYHRGGDKTTGIALKLAMS